MWEILGGLFVLYLMWEWFLRDWIIDIIEMIQEVKKDKKVNKE